MRGKETILNEHGRRACLRGLWGAGMSEEATQPSRDTQALNSSRRRLLLEALPCTMASHVYTFPTRCCDVRTTLHLPPPLCLTGWATRALHLLFTLLEPSHLFCGSTGGPITQLDKVHLKLRASSLWSDRGIHHELGTMRCATPHVHTPPLLIRQVYPSRSLIQCTAHLHTSTFPLLVRQVDSP